MAHLLALAPVAPAAVLRRVQRVWVERDRGCRRLRLGGGFVIRAEHAKRESTVVSRVLCPPKGEGWGGSVSEVIWRQQCEEGVATREGAPAVGRSPPGEERLCGGVMRIGSRAQSARPGAVHMRMQCPQGAEGLAPTLPPSLGLGGGAYPGVDLPPPQCSVEVRGGSTESMNSKVKPAADIEAISNHAASFGPYRVWARRGYSGKVDRRF